MLSSGEKPLAFTFLVWKNFSLPTFEFRWINLEDQESQNYASQKRSALKKKSVSLPRNGENGENGFCFLFHCFVFSFSFLAFFQKRSFLARARMTHFLWLFMLRKKSKIPKLDMESFFISLHGKRRFSTTKKMAVNERDSSKASIDHSGQWLDSKAPVERKSKVRKSKARRSKARKARKSNKLYWNNRIGYLHSVKLRFSYI